MTTVLPAPLWADIRRRWEYDPDCPSFADAAKRSSGAHGFTAPGRSAVHARAHREGWARKGAPMSSVAAAAALRADSLVDAEGAKKAADSAESAVEAFERAANDRAAVLARHRTEWGVVGELVSEALEDRAADPVDAFNRAKLAKITTETLALRQAGERKAWGLDSFAEPGSDIDVAKLTDAELEAISKGRMPKSLTR